MILSEKYKFLFIHVPKTGGTSLNAALVKYGRPAEKLAYAGNTIPGVRTVLHKLTKGDPIREITGLNPHAGYQVVRAHFGEEVVADLFSFAITRNPYTRAISFYHHAKRIPGHPEHNTANRLSFSDYVGHTLERDETAPPQAKRFTQLPFLTDWKSGTLAVKGLLALERLIEDLAELETVLKLPARIKVDHLNSDPAPPKDIEALFGASAAPFAEKLADDFSLLGYSTNLADAHKPPGRDGIVL